MLSARKLRRIAEQQARKQARKTGFPTEHIPTQPPNHPPSESAPPAVENTEPQADTPISPERLAANQRNAQFSTGPKSSATKSISAQNSVVHGLARHINGTFKLMDDEDHSAFAKFRESLITEHTPETETENVLVIAMAESHWLAQRAQRLQNTCVNPENGTITDPKMFSLYLRYQSAHHRSFHKSLSTLQKLRSDQQKTERGFVAQKRQADAQRIKNERHEMKKDFHPMDLASKNNQICDQLLANRLKMREAEKQYPGFMADLQADLEKQAAA